MIEGGWKYFRLIIGAKEVAKIWFNSKKNYIDMREKGDLKFGIFVLKEIWKFKAVVYVLPVYSMYNVYWIGPPRPRKKNV